MKKIVIILTIMLMIMGCGKSEKERSSFKLKVNVKDESGNIVTGVKVSFDNLEKFTDLNGTAVIEGIKNKNGVILVSGTGYESLSENFTIKSENEEKLIIIKKIKNIRYYKSRGYGYVIKIEDKNIEFYDCAGRKIIKQDSTFQFGEMIIDGSNVYNDERERVAEFKDRIFSEGTKKYYFQEISDITQYEIIKKGDNNPELNFEYFWSTFDEHCSLFDVVGLDWKSVYNKYRPLINKSTNNEELFDMFCKMVSDLNDFHLNIGIFDEEKGKFSKVYNAGKSSEESEFMDKNRDNMLGIVSEYFDSFNAEKNIIANGNIIFGTVNNGKTGYIAINSFDEYTEGQSIENEIEEYKKIMEKLSKEFEALKTENYIVDLRFNGGGLDELGLETVKYFADKSYFAYSKKVRNGKYDEYDCENKFYIEPVKNWMTGKKTVVLTGINTASAADVAAMTFKAAEGNITLAGGRTEGIFSDMLLKRLPNGWLFTLSNERYFDNNGINNEQKGIIPDISMEYDKTMIEKKRDNIIEKAIELLK